MKIKIKETSKSGDIANIDGIYGKIIQGQFVPYTPAELEKKTAYKDPYGYKEYESIEAFLEEKKQLKLQRKLENEAYAIERAEKRKAENAKLMAMIEAGPIPATIENVRLLLQWLNEQNWGSWDLPAMTIGYSAHQYDCDGVTATTITLDKPISDEFITSERRFVVGAPRGHLSKYQRL
jgi:hypothetical protein